MTVEFVSLDFSAKLNLRAHGDGTPIEGEIWYGGGREFKFAFTRQAMADEGVGMHVLRSKVAEAVLMAHREHVLRCAVDVIEMTTAGDANKRRCSDPSDTFSYYVGEWERRGTRALYFEFDLVGGKPCSSMCKVSVAESELGPTDRGMIQDPQWDSVIVDMEASGIPPCVLGEYRRAVRAVDRPRK
jgi:hypothetical protein